MKAKSESRENGYIMFEKDYLTDRRFLDGYNLGSDLPPISAVVPTYNRCPFPLGTKSNPLEWALDTLALQKSSGLEEVVVVDDNSNDYTSQVVESYRGSFPVDLRYVQHGFNQGSSKTKNRGLLESRADRVIFLDDDCLFSPYSIFGANYTLDQLENEASVVHIPVYYRRENPFLVPKSEIGVWDARSGRMTGNFGGFPEEYMDASGEEFLDRSRKILAPVPITNLAGVFAVKKGDFELARGFPDFFTWTNGYREETNLGIQLTRHGKTMYMTPDPKFSAVHLKYGSKDVHDHPTGLAPDLKRLVDLSNVDRGVTGNRVSGDDWFHNRIISTYVTFSLSDEGAGRKFAGRARREFVDDNVWEVSGSREKIDDFQRRLEIYQAAISGGDEVLVEAKSRGLI